MYLRESPVWKIEVGILDCVKYFHTLFDGFTWINNNCCEVDFVTNSFSTFGVYYIGLPILVY